jgi:uncharacterized protein (DUF488 family)
MSEVQATADTDGLALRSALTLGYGSRTVEEVAGLLTRHGVRFVVDVRSVPWSRFRPEFSQDRLVPALREHGIRYVFMGDELGGRPDDGTCYDNDGHVDYRACAQRAEFQAGIARLRAACNAGHSIAIMCSEARPEDCHRTKLVAQALVGAGVDVQHLDQHGQLQSQDDVLDRLRSSQMSLLGGDERLLKSRGRYRVASA